MEFSKRKGCKEGGFTDSYYFDSGWWTTLNNSMNNSNTKYLPEDQSTLKLSKTMPFNLRARTHTMIFAMVVDVGRETFMFRAGLTAQNPAGFPAFSPGKKPTRRLSTDYSCVSFGSPISCRDSSHFPVGNNLGLRRPGNSPPPSLVRLL